MALLCNIHNLMKRGGTPNGTTEWSAVLLQILCDTLSNIQDPSHVSATAGKIICLATDMGLRGARTTFDAKPDVDVDI
jgi:hypothetical protein